MLGFAIGLRQSAGVVATPTPTPTPSYDAASIAYFAAMTVQPDSERKRVLNDLIVGLKQDGVWSLLDWLILTAAHDEQAGRVNARAPAKVATPINAPTFAVDRGYAGNGMSTYLDLGETYQAGGQFSQNLAHASVWLNSGIGTNASIGVNGNPATTVLHNALSGTAATVRLNSGGMSITWPSVLGHHLITRTTDTSYVYNNGVQFAAIASVSSVPTTASATILRNSATYSGDRVAAMSSGAMLSASQAQALYARLNSYLTAIGGA